jgi:hypothetical protein
MMSLGYDSAADVFVLDDGTRLDPKIREILHHTEDMGDSGDNCWNRKSFLRFRVKDSYDVRVLHDLTLGGQLSLEDVNVCIRKYGDADVRHLEISQYYLPIWGPKNLAIRNLFLSACDEKMKDDFLDKIPIGNSDCGIFVGERVFRVTVDAIITDNVSTMPENRDVYFWDFVRSGPLGMVKRETAKAVLPPSAQVELKLHFTTCDHIQDSFNVYWWQVVHVQVFADWNDQDLQAIQSFDTLESSWKAMKKPSRRRKGAQDTLKPYRPLTTST